MGAGAPVGVKIPIPPLSPWITIPLLRGGIVSFKLKDVHPLRYSIEQKRCINLEKNCKNM